MSIQSATQKNYIQWEASHSKGQMVLQSLIGVVQIATTIGGPISSCKLASH